MYSTGQFDGSAAFSGGGFMPSQATQATTSDFSFSPAKNRDTQALLPLTVKQINEAMLSTDEKSNFLVDGVEVTNVTLVGMVFNKAERVTDVSFALDDGTGRIDCHRWVNEAADAREMEAILRSRKVQVGITAQPQVTNPVVNSPLKGYPPSNQYSAQYGSDGLNSIDQRVIDFLQQPSCLARVQGVHRDELVEQLNIPVAKIMQSIRSLEEEGLIYSTIDDVHFKSTGNG